jgi:hypothetical protein
MQRNRHTVRLTHERSTGVARADTCERERVDRQHRRRCSSERARGRPNSSARLGVESQSACRGRNCGAVTDLSRFRAERERAHWTPERSALSTREVCAEIRPGARTGAAARRPASRSAAERAPLSGSTGAAPLSGERRSSTAAVRDAVLAIRRADGAAAFALDLDRRWASRVAESAGGRFDRAEVRLGSARVMGRTLVAVGSRRLLRAVAV